MKWSNELPEVPGWYWVKTDDWTCIVALQKDAHGLFFWINGRLQKIYQELNWQFAGPIQEPTDPIQTPSPPAKP